MPYAIDTVNAILTRLDSLLGHRALAVGTDLIGNLKDSARRGFTVENRRGNQYRIELAEEHAIQDRELVRFAATLQLPHDRARDVVVAARALTELNPRGWWCLWPEVSEAPPLACTARQLGGTIDQAIAFLDESMPLIESINAETSLQTTGGKRGRRRTWVRVDVDDDTEAAAWNPGMFAVHIRDGFMAEPHEHLEANLLRLSVWARQVGTDRDLMPAILHHVAFLTVTLGLTRVDLSRRTAWGTRTSGP